MTTEKRECDYCGFEIKIPHMRTWEENRLTPKVKLFCNKRCMIAYYTEKYVKGE